MTAPQAVKKLHPCLIACVGATIGRPPTYRRNAFSGTVFLQGKRARASNARPYKRFSAVPRRGQDPLPTEQKEKSASKETCPGEINPAPAHKRQSCNNGKAAGRALGGAQRAPPVCKQTRSCGCLPRRGKHCSLHAHNPAMPGPYASVCLNAFHSSLFSGAHHAPNSKAVSTTKGRPCGKNQSRRDQPPGRGAKRRRQQHHRAPMAAHL